MYCCSKVIDSSSTEADEKSEKDIVIGNQEPSSSALGDVELTARKHETCSVL